MPTNLQRFNEVHGTEEGFHLGVCLQLAHQVTFPLLDDFVALCSQEQRPFQGLVEGFAHLQLSEGSQSVAVLVAARTTVECA